LLLKLTIANATAADAIHKKILKKKLKYQCIAGTNTDYVLQWKDPV